jgi:hypothetical protein
MQFSFLILDVWLWEKNFPKKFHPQTCQRVKYLILEFFKFVQVLQSVIDKRLSSSLGSLYGPHLTCHLSLAQAHLLITTVDTIPVIPEVIDEQPAR